MRPGYGQAFFGRGVCHYRLGRYRQAAEDMDAATLLGCETAQLWSTFNLHFWDDDDDVE
jgi:hypothetical protein